VEAQHSIKAQTGGQGPEQPALVSEVAFPNLPAGQSRADLQPTPHQVPGVVAVHATGEEAKKPALHARLTTAPVSGSTVQVWPAAQALQCAASAAGRLALA
jgi:hypothetical protein